MAPQRVQITVHTKDADGYVRADVTHLSRPIYSRDRLSPDGKHVTMTARERAIREAKARVLEADAAWIRSGGCGTRPIEGYFDIVDINPPADP